MNQRPSRRGFTLPELLIAGALFIALSAMAAYGLMIGMRAQEFDKNVRESQLAARDIVNRLVDEMRTATVLPMVGLGSSQVPSGVLFPDPYGTSPSPFTGIYTVGTTGSGAYFSKNRVIFSRPATESAGAAFDPSNLNQYVYVEWIIPANPTIGNTPWNRIYRKVHNVGTTSPGHQLTGGRWLIRAAYFTAASGLRNTTEESWLVARMPGADDILELTVERPPYLSPSTGAPGTEVSYNTNYDRNLLKVVLKATTFRRGDKSTTPGARKNETTQESQVRLQSGT